MEQKNAYSETSGPTGRNSRNRTVDGYKQIGVTILVLFGVVAATVDSPVVRAIMVAALTVSLLVALILWAGKRYSR